MKINSNLIAIANFSETETLIGSWLGSPLYRKVINTGALPNNTTKDTPYNISNLNRIISIEGYAYRSNDNFTVSLPFVSTSDINFNIYVGVIGNNIRIQTGTDRTSFTESYVILEYTKTS